MDSVEQLTQMLERLARTVDRMADVLIAHDNRLKKLEKGS